MMMNQRVGIGYDVHRIVPGRKLILGGVEVPSDKGLLGHSDADVLCHAMADALLGAAALGDIGKHFPDTDPKYKDISSLVLLRHVGGLIRSHNFEIMNVDSTLILQQPKIASFVKEMRENIATALGIDTNQVSIKATTNEGLDSFGTGDGAAVHAIASIQSRRMNF
jgi:2-C-methyl-D-erythritol 2,4-cyclodiphosphate synthase